MRCHGIRPSSTLPTCSAGRERGGSGKGASNLSGHRALVLQIFVAHDELAHVFRCGALDFEQPCPQIGERFQVGDVVGEKDAIRRGDGSEAFLSCCVPYLELESFAVDAHRLELEVDADGTHIGIAVCAVCESQ